MIPAEADFSFFKFIRPSKEDVRGKTCLILVPNDVNPSNS